MGIPDAIVTNPFANFTISGTTADGGGNFSYDVSLDKTKTKLYCQVYLVGRLKIKIPNYL